MAYAACAVFGLAVTAVSASAETVREAVAQALETYPDIKAALANRAAVAEELVASKAQRMPKVDVSARTSAYKSKVSSSDNLVISLSASQSLYDGGATTAAVRQHHEELDAEQQRVVDQALEIGLQAAIAYISVQQARDTVLVTRRNMESLRDIARRVELRVSAGFGSDTDLLDVRLKLQNAKLNLLEAEDQANKAVLNYRNLTGASPGKLKAIAISRFGLPATVEEAVALARDASPKVMALLSDARAADAAVAGVLAANRPQVGVDLGVNLNQDMGTPWDRSQDVSARFTVSMNLFDGGMTKARARKARYVAYASRYRAQSAGLAMEQQIRNAWIDVESGRQRVQLLTQQQKTARQSLALYLKRFDAGVEPLQRLLDVQSEVAAVDMAKVGATYTTLATGFRLLAGTGRLLAALGIEFDARANPNG